MRADVLEPFQRLPTTDLYFLEPLRRLQRAGAVHGRPRRIGRHVYRIADLVVISRYASTTELVRIEAQRGCRVVYLADDDFAAAAEDGTLPGAYRRRLEAFCQGPWRALCALATHVVVPNATLAAVYGDRAHVAPPVWPLPYADAEHFEAGGPLDIVLLGGRSHAGDAAALAPALRDALGSAPNVRLTDYSGHGLGLDGHGVPVRLRRALPWWRYRRHLARQRFHLALYPLRPTRFNTARSINKLLEHAVVGAAALVTRFPALDEWPELVAPHLVLGAPPAGWTQSLRALVGDRATLRAEAQAARLRVLGADPAARTLELWRALLDGSA